MRISSGWLILGLSALGLGFEGCAGKVVSEDPDVDGSEAGASATDADSSASGGAGGRSAQSGGAPSEGQEGATNDLDQIEIPFGCAAEDEITCLGTNQQVRVICHDYTAYGHDACVSGERCDTQTGECAPMLPECGGAEPFVGLCVGDVYVECGIDLLDRTYEEDCSERCQPRAGGADCIQLGCGDGTVASTESCDDGNNLSGDGCSAKCTWDPPLGPPPASGVTSFGQAVALSEETIAVLAKSEIGSGNVSIFRQDGIAWRLEAILGGADDPTATNREAEATLFGESLQLEGDTLAVSGIDAGGEDEVVLVYQRSGSSWKLAAKVIPALPETPDVRDETSQFGALALSGDTLVVGATYDQNKAPFAGAAYVYRRSGDAWLPEQKLFAEKPEGGSDAAESNWFGTAVATDGTRILVGANGKDGVTFYVGAAYVYVRRGDGWALESRFVPPYPEVALDDTGGPQCGSSVAISGDTAVVGCGYDETEAGPYGGSAYVLERQGNDWSMQDYLLPSPGTHPKDDASIAEFGAVVDISADEQLIAIGSPRDRNDRMHFGSAHFFQKSDSGWSPTKLVASPPRGVAPDEGPLASFGQSLAISNGRVLIGASQAEESGRAYLYQFTESEWPLRLKLQAVSP